MIGSALEEWFFEGREKDRRANDPILKQKVK